MNTQELGLSLRMLMASAVLAGLTACAAAQQAMPEEGSAQQAAKPDAAGAQTTAVAVPPAQPVRAAPEATTSTVAELQALIVSRKVTELRTTYNGSYGASLLFKADDLMYYVTLFQQGDLWRVVKISSQPQAEATYRAFVAQTVELAAVDLSRIRLQAEYAHAEKQLAARTEQLNTLQADQTLREQQEQLVAARQAQLHQEASMLNEQREDVRTQLQALQRRIDSLKAEQELVGPPAGKPAAAVSRHRDR